MPPALEGDESQRAGETAPGPGSQRAQAAAPATAAASAPRRRIGERAPPDDRRHARLGGLRAPQRGERRRASLRPAARRALDSRSRSRRPPTAPPPLPAGTSRWRCSTCSTSGASCFDGNKAASLFTGRHTAPSTISPGASRSPDAFCGAAAPYGTASCTPPSRSSSAERKPLAIVCTHITAANVAVAGAHARRPTTSPSCACPPSTRPKGLWPHLSTDLFCVANESMAETLRPRKVPEERILITGIPTREDFRRP